MSEYRIEHDSMGEVRVPADAKWRAQTQRAVENFPISGQRIERAHIEALARIKAAAAKVNAGLGVLDKDIAEAIQEAAAEVVDGKWDEHFPVDVFQTGSGTSSNMNTNEVIATLATERLGRDVHPNDHVNASQSSATTSSPPPSTSPPRPPSPATSSPPSSTSPTRWSASPRSSPTS